MPYTPLPTTPVDFPTTYAINCFEVETERGFKLTIHGTDQRRTLDTSPNATPVVTALCGLLARRANTPAAFPAEPTPYGAFDRCPECVAVAAYYEAD